MKNDKGAPSKKKRTAKPLLYRLGSFLYFFFIYLYNFFSSIFILIIMARTTKPPII